VAVAVGPNDEIAAVAVDMLGKLISATSKLFDSKVTMYESCAPDFANDNYPVFGVETRLTPQEAAEAEREWIRQVESIAPAWKNLRLSIRFAHDS
jgi:hypothetical protein